MDEAWVCAGCHSINLARAGRCYHCHLRRGASLSPEPEPNVLHVAAPVSEEPAPATGLPSPARELAEAAATAAATPAPASIEDDGLLGMGSDEAEASPALEAIPGAVIPVVTQPIWPGSVAAGPTRPRRTTLLAGAAVLVAAAVLLTSFAFVPGWLSSAGPSASPGASGALASASPASSPGSASASASSVASLPTGSPTASARIPGGAIGGTWLARIALVPSGSADLTGQVPFQDRILDIEAGCANEPCPTARLRIYFLNDPQFVYEASLQRAGDTYRSAAVAAGGAPCLTKSGSQVPSGATVTRTISAWRERVTTQGTAITSEQVRGEIRYDATPTKIGDLAGCGAWSAIYQVSAEDPWSVPTLPPSPSPEPTPPPGSVLITLPALTYPISGARVDYFPIAGSTAAALLDSLPRSGVKACGEIQYDWYEGDPRPVGCVLPSWNQGAFVPLVNASGVCRIGVTASALSYTVELPQWTQPRFVPKPLLDWWKRVLTFIGTHEATHIRIFQQYAAMLPGRLSGVDCLQAPAVVNTWAGQLQAAQSAFDKADYSKPWPTPPPGY